MLIPTLIFSHEQCTCGQCPNPNRIVISVNWLFWQAGLGYFIA